MLEFFLETFVLHTLIVWLLLVGCACPLALRLRLDPEEQVLASATLSVLLIFLFAWVIYVSGLPWILFRGLVLVAFIGVVLRVPKLAEFFRQRAASRMILAQMLLSACSLAWLMTVASYSGGGWTGDWVEHWERAKFFIERIEITTIC